MAFCSINADILLVNALRAHPDKWHYLYPLALQKFAELELNEADYQPWTVDHDTPLEASMEGAGIALWIKDTRLPKPDGEGKFVGEEETRAEYVKLLGRLIVTLKRRF